MPTHENLANPASELSSRGTEEEISGERSAVSSGQETQKIITMGNKIVTSDEMYKGVVDNIAIGVALISPRMEILAINKQMRNWFPTVKVSDHPLCYHSFNDPPGKEICSYCPTYKTLKDGEVHESMTETPSKGGIINFRVVSSPIKDSDGSVIAAIEMVEDITERRRTRRKNQIHESSCFAHSRKPLRMEFLVCRP